MLTENKFSKYLIYAVGEIVLVVIGILIALSINNWNQKNSDRKIEQDYISSLIEDAKTDLSNFENAIALNEKRVKILDSLSLKCFSYDAKDNKDPELMIWYLKSLKFPDFIAQTERTLSQLKNSGGMRFIKDKNKTDAIVKYETSFKSLYNQQIWYEEGLKDLLNAGITIFNLKHLPKPNEEFDRKAFIKTARLLNNDRKLIIELGNRVINYNLLTNTYLNFLKKAKLECLELIDILENKNTTILTK